MAYRKALGEGTSITGHASGGINANTHCHRGICIPHFIFNQCSLSSRSFFTRRPQYFPSGIDGSWEDEHGNDRPAAGETIPLTVVVENTGTVTLGALSVSDSINSTGCTSAKPFRLVQGEQHECIAVLQVGKRNWNSSVAGFTIYARAGYFIRWVRPALSPNSSEGRSVHSP